jgi:radical SAM superfamily enzyme YgiQ (UPF0313 family)
LATIRIAKDREMLELAEKSGCGGLLIGIETLSTSSVLHINKPFNKPEEYIEAVRILHGHGIAINGCFVLGLDGDDASSFERTVEFVNKAAIDLPRFSVATPFPGTPLFRQLEAEGRLLSRDWRFYGGQNVVYRPRNMSVDTLQEGLRWTWRQAYGASSIVRRIARSGASRSARVLSTTFFANLGYSVYARLLPDYLPMPCEVDPWKERLTA